MQALGDPLIDSVVSENIPILTADEKFNETVSSIVRRVEAVLTGKTQAPKNTAASHTHCMSRGDGRRLLTRPLVAVLSEGAFTAIQDLLQEVSDLAFYSLKDLLPQMVKHWPKPTSLETELISRSNYLQQ